IDCDAKPKRELIRACRAIRDLGPKGRTRKARAALTNAHPAIRQYWDPVRLVGQSERKGWMNSLFAPAPPLGPKGRTRKARAALTNAHPAISKHCEHVLRDGQSDRKGWMNSLFDPAPPLSGTARKLI